MAFKTGRSGNPAGRPVSVAKLAQYFTSHEALIVLVRRAALEGDTQAIAWLREAYAARDGA